MDTATLGNVIRVAQNTTAYLRKELAKGEGHRKGPYLEALITNDEFLTALIATNLKTVPDARQWLLGLQGKPEHELKRNSDYLRIFQHYEKIVYKFERYAGTNAAPPNFTSMHELTPFNYAFSPDGSAVAVGESRGGVSIYDAHSGEKLSQFEQGTSNKVLTYTKPAFSPNGTNITFGNLMGKLVVYDWKSGKLVCDATYGMEAVYSPVFSPDGMKLASGNDEGEIVVVNVGNGKTLAQKKVSEEALGDLSYSPDGQVLTAVDEAGSLFILDSSLKRGLKKSICKDWPNSYVVFSGDGKVMALQRSKTLSFFDTATWEKRAEWKSTMRNVALAYDGSKVALGPDRAAGQKTLIVRDKDTKKELCRFTPSHKDEMIRFSSDDKAIEVGLPVGKIQTFSL